MPLELWTNYPSSAAGSAFTYAASVTMANNGDPAPANNSRVVNATLF